MLTGKCPDSHHLRIKSEVKQKLETMISVVEIEELLFPPTAQNEKGRAIKRKRKEASPKVKTGSAMKECKKADSIDIA